MQGLVQFWSENGAIGRTVVVLLLAMSVSAWVLIFWKGWVLSVSASDRSGLLYSIARVLAKHDINLQLAKISTLGERVEDTFLVDGAALQHNRSQIEFETELLDALS